MRSLMPVLFSILVLVLLFLLVLGIANTIMLSGRPIGATGKLYGPGHSPVPTQQSKSPVEQTQIAKKHEQEITAYLTARAQTQIVPTVVPSIVPTPTNSK